MALAAGFGFIVLIYLAVAILLVASSWIIYTKADQPGWAVFIPVYDLIILLRVIQKPWWWIILFIIPPVTIIIYILILHALSLKFGQNVWFTLGLLFLPVIFFPVLAFGDYRYMNDGDSSDFE